MVRPARRPPTAKAFALATRTLQRAAGADRGARPGSASPACARRRRGSTAPRAAGHAAAVGVGVGVGASGFATIATAQVEKCPTTPVKRTSRCCVARPARSRPRTAAWPGRAQRERLEGTAGRVASGGQRRAAVREPGEQRVARGLAEPGEPNVEGQPPPGSSAWGRRTRSGTPRPGRRPPRAGARQDRSRVTAKATGALNAPAGRTARIRASSCSLSIAVTRPRWCRRRCRSRPCPGPGRRPASRRRGRAGRRRWTRA